MKFFRLLNWAEWLCIGMLTTALSVALYLYHDNIALSETIGGDKEIINQLETNNQLQTDSAKITDDTVADFIKQKDITQVEQDQSRVGAINEYIDQAVAKPVSSNAKPAPSLRPTTLPTTTVDNTAVRERISILADRMREHYCKAAPGASDCATGSVAK